MKGKLHICFNLISDPNWHAGNIYIFNLVEALSLLPDEERKQIFLSIAARKPNEVPDSIRSKLDHLYSDHFFILAWRKVLTNLPGFMRRSWFNFRKIDFYYPAGNFKTPWPYSWAGWIPDFQYHHLPHLFSREEIESRQNRNQFLANESQAVVLSSKHAMNDFIQLFPQHAHKAELLQFVSSADPKWIAGDVEPVVRKHHLPERFYLICNQFWKHKDHEVLIECLALLKSKGIKPNFVCTGATEDFRNPEYFPGLLRKAEELHITDQFIVLGFISREDQIQLMRKSLAMIQPSRFEGWSTVVEDARTLGKPILLSDFPVHVEQNPEQGIYFKCGNAHELAELIMKHDAQFMPGPDKSTESVALQKNRERRLKFGETILQIARKVSHLNQ